MPVDEPDGRQQAEPAEKNSPAAEESQKRPETLKITSDGEDSLQTESTSGVTASSTMNGMSPLQPDLTTTVETEEEIISPGPDPDFPSLETPQVEEGGVSTPGSCRASPDKTITEKFRKKIRHFSGARSDSNPPPLDAPVTEEKFRYVLNYLKDMEVTAIVDYLNSKASDLRADATLDDETGKKAVHILCETDNASINVFKALQKCGHRFSIFTKKGFTTLHLAVRKFNNDIASDLVRLHPELINIPDQDGLTPLHVAVAYRNKPAFDLMAASQQADLTVLTERNKMSPLHLAIKILNRLLHTDTQEEEEENLLKDILNMETIIETIIRRTSQEGLHRAMMEKFTTGPEENEFPLHLLGRLKQLRAIRELSEKIAHPSVWVALNGEGQTPFLSCLQEAWVRRVVRQPSLQDSALQRELMEKQESEEREEEEENKNGKKKKKTKTKSKKSSPETPYEIYLEVCRYLLEHLTTDVDAPCRQHCGSLTPLQMILYRCQNLPVERDLVEKLLDKGADVLIENDYDSPIEIVLSTNFRRDILRLFIDHIQAENINDKDCNHSTVLHYAVSIGDKDFITKLLEKQADPTIAALSPDFTDVDFYNNPDAKIPRVTLKKTPLDLALNHATVEVYFEALRKADISEVIRHIKDDQLLSFFQSHLSAASCFSAKEVVRDLSMLLSNKSIIGRISCDSKVEDCARLVIGQIIHYQDTTHHEKTFHKTSLAWANENDDPITASDLIHLEYRHHQDKEEGISCIKKQLTNDRLLFWITRTFGKFYPTVSFKKWCQAIFVSLIQLGVSYFFFIFDLVSDYQLTKDYYEAYTNTNNYSYQMLQCARVGNGSHSSGGFSAGSSCFNFTNEIPDNHYYVAMCLTYLSMTLSLAVYVFGILFFFDVTNITEKFRAREITPPEKRSEVRDQMLRFRFAVENFLLKILIKLFWPCFHLYRKIRYEATKNKSSRREKLIEFDGIWFMVKTIEYGIEATIQLKIVLYLLVPYYDEIHDWNFQTTIQKVADGLLHFLTAGRFKACLLDKVIGKLAFNVLSQTASLTMLKYLKYGMSPLEHVGNMAPLFLSYLIQIWARVLVIRVFFVTAEDLFGLEDNKGLAIGLFFAIHFALLLVIKLIFELGGMPSAQCDLESLVRCARFWLRFLINWVSSSFVYVWSTGYGSKPRDNIHEHNTALPQSLFQLLILLEHLVLVLYPVYQVDMDCLDRDTYLKTSWLVPVMWVLSNLCLVFHYSSCHTWSSINGPAREDQSLGCFSNICRQQYRLTMDHHPPFLHGEKSGAGTCHNCHTSNTSNTSNTFNTNNVKENNHEMINLL